MLKWTLKSELVITAIKLKILADMKFNGKKKSPLKSSSIELELYKDKILHISFPPLSWLLQ